MNSRQVLLFATLVCVSLTACGGEKPSRRASRASAAAEQEEEELGRKVGRCRVLDEDGDRRVRHGKAGFEVLLPGRHWAVECNKAPLMEAVSRKFNVNLKVTRESMEETTTDEEMRAYLHKQLTREAREAGGVLREVGTVPGGLVTALLADRGGALATTVFRKTARPGRWLVLTVYAPLPYEKKALAVANAQESLEIAQSFRVEGATEPAPQAQPAAPVTPTRVPF